MSKQLLLKNYRQNVIKLKNRAKALNISDKELKKIFEECISILKNDNAYINNKSKLALIGKTLLVVTIIALIFYIVLNVHQPTSSIVLRNIQELIYPGLKLLRYFTVPIIRKFPSLTTFYYESCLVENPYFYVSDMECWPCENVHSVVDLTGYNNFSLYKSGVPYTVKTNQALITFDHLKQIYLKNYKVFNADANNIKSRNSKLYLKELFHKNFTETDHYVWRINRMVPARILRKVFPKPYIISEWSGQSIERYILIDGPQSLPYKFPNFECSYIFVVQGSGERTIILKPTKECAGSCKTISVILKPSYVLWYNWWYWRPISLPVENGTNFSISYISSYC